MKRRVFTVAWCLWGLTFVALLAWRGAQAQAPSASGPPATARVETVPVELTQPERYQAPLTLEPGRRATLIAPVDEVLRSVSAPVGSPVREGQEVAGLDRAEAIALQKIADANVKEMQAEADEARSKGSKAALAVAEARLEAARARAELARLDVERRTLRAPFAGRVLAASIAPGQYVPKGTIVAEVADVSGFRVLMPVDRAAVKEGSTLNLVVEGKPATGRVQALLPLADSFAVLRELATPWAGAWVGVENRGGALEPGQRVL